MSFSWLPSILAEIADIAGLDAALQIAESRGGTSVYIPVSAPDDHWLVEAVGREAADIICQHFAFSVDGMARHGVTVELPLGPRGSLAKIKGMVDRMIGEGKSEREIALAAGYTERGVRRRKAKVANLIGNEKQGRLF